MLRFAHFLALAAITVRFLPKDWPGLKSPWLRPLILCGQHSLEIFCLGVFLAFAGHFVLAEVSGRCRDAFCYQYFRNRHHVCGGVAVFVVQGRSPTRAERAQKATTAMPISREGAL